MGIIKNKTKNFGTPEMLPPPKKQTTWYVALLVDIFKNRDSLLFTYICKPGLYFSQVIKGHVVF